MDDKIGKGVPTNPKVSIFIDPYPIGSSEYPLTYDRNVGNYTHIFVTEQRGRKIGDEWAQSMIDGNATANPVCPYCDLGALQCRCGE